MDHATPTRSVVVEPHAFSVAPFLMRISIEQDRWNEHPGRSIISSSLVTVVDITEPPQNSKGLPQLSTRSRSLLMTGTEPSSTMHECHASATRVVTNAGTVSDATTTLRQLTPHDAK